MPYINTSSSYIEISASAFAHNIACYKQLIANGELGIVVKGNAYGHGIDEILSLTKDNPAIAWYFTASLSEALYIRAQGITKPILVLSILDRDPLPAFEQDIRLIFHCREQFADLARAQYHNVQPKVHLKVDTGLGRFGFLPDECISIIQQLQSMPHVIIEGIFTHFAQAETPDQSYTNVQMQRFSDLIDEIESIVHIPYVHSHATSATLFHNNTKTNLFRIGAGLYGLWPSYDIQRHTEQHHALSLTQVMTWKTHIAHIRILNAGTSIGYGCSYIASKDMRIALLPVGYADGYQRRFSNIGHVYINGHLAPIIGRIGMNSFSVDISTIPEVHIGTEVILTGPQAGITALDLAHAVSGFNPREITVSIASCKRMVVHEEFTVDPIAAFSPFLYPHLR